MLLTLYFTTRLFKSEQTAKLVIDCELEGTCIFSNDYWKRINEIVLNSLNLPTEQTPTNVDVIRATKLVKVESLNMIKHSVSAAASVNISGSFWKW